MFNDKGIERPSPPLPAPTEQPRPEQARTSPLDNTPNTDFAAELQHPGNTLSNAAAATATTRETGVSHESAGTPPPSRSLFQRASNAVVGLLSSNNFYTSFGNVIITSNLWSLVLYGGVIRKRGKYGKRLNRACNRWRKLLSAHLVMILNVCLSKKQASSQVHF